MAERFINIDRDTPMLLPVDLREWIPEGHIVHYILDVVGTLDTRAFETNVRGSGSAQYPPSMMLSLLIYCYATGRFSSRVIEEASHSDIAVRYICAGTHPDHDTICTFRRRNRKAFERFFVHVLEVASRGGVLKKVGTVSVDGTKIKANASKHSAMSHGHAVKVLEQLEHEVALLTKKAEQADNTAEQECTVNLPDEIARREQRRQSIAHAVAIIEERQRAAHQEKLQQHKEKVAAYEQKRVAGKGSGKAPKEPQQTIDPKAQYNFTDPQSRIMKAGSGQHFEQCYNAQAAVDVDSMLVVSNHITASATDKRQLLDSLAGAARNGYQVTTVLADNGYYSEANIDACASGKVEPLLAMGKDKHGMSLARVLGEEVEPEAPAADASAKERMAYTLSSKDGRSRYGLRKQTVEPVFGIIKQNMRFRQFLMRGKQKVANEWNLVCSAYNLKRTFNLLRMRQATALTSSGEIPA